MPRPLKRFVRSEKVEQSHIVQLLRSLSAKVYVIGTRRRSGDYQGTMQTPGIPDLLAFMPPRVGILMKAPVIPALLVFVEAKRERGQVRPEQRVFRDLCQQANVEHVLGTYDAVVGWCIGRGYLKADQVPHYRVDPVQTVSEPRRRVQ